MIRNEIAVTVALAALGGSYAVGYAQGEKALAMCEAMKKVGFDNLIKDFSQINSELKENLKVLEENKKLKNQLALAREATLSEKKRNIEYENKNTELSNQLHITKEELKKLNGEITSYTISEGNAQRVTPETYVGLVHSTISMAEIIVDNAQLKVFPGSKIEIPHSSGSKRRCIMTIVSINYSIDNVDLNVACR